MAAPPVPEHEIVDSTGMTFQSHAAEGDNLFKQGSFQKAIESYSKALLLKPTERHILVSRSKCYLQLGDTTNALKDADASLIGEEDFFKGIFQKAEALYTRGDFELALVFYHRGNQLRPELDEFRLGIQKAIEAIDNSIGNPKNYKFQPPPGVRLVTSDNKTAPFATGEWQTPKIPANQTNQTSNSQKETKSERSSHKLLGELNADREYLYKFITDKDFDDNPNEKVQELVQGALAYLDTRTDFWRQQKPMYARKKETMKQSHQSVQSRNRESIVQKGEEFKKREAASKAKSDNPKAAGGFKRKPSNAEPIKAEAAGPVKTKTQTLVDTNLFMINNHLTKGNYQFAMRKTKALLTKLSSNPKGLPNSVKIQGLLLSKSINQQGLIFRSQCSIGRTLVQLQKYSKAIPIFQECLSTTESDTEKQWLLHDIGRSYLHLQNYDLAYEFAQEALDITLPDDLKWGINIAVLMAQSKIGKKQYTDAYELYQNAFTQSKAYGDKNVGLSLWRAMEDLKLIQITKEKKKDSVKLEEGYDKLDDSKCQVVV